MCTGCMQGFRDQAIDVLGFSPTDRRQYQTIQPDGQRHAQVICKYSAKPTSTYISWSLFSTMRRTVLPGSLRSFYVELTHVHYSRQLSLGMTQYQQPVITYEPEPMCSSRLGRISWKHRTARSSKPISIDATRLSRWGSRDVGHHRSSTARRPQAYRHVDWTFFQL